MTLYLKNLLPRIREYGKQLDKIEEFVDKTWTLVDDNGNLTTYRFKRDHRLIITVDGDFTEYRWEMEGLDAMSIREPRSTSGKMFRHGFVLPGLFAFQKESKEYEPVLFYNDAIVQDGDVLSYIQRELTAKLNVRPIQGNEKYYIDNYSSEMRPVGSRIYNSDFQQVIDDNVQLGTQTLHISNGVVKCAYEDTVYESNRGPVIITQVNGNGVTQGNKIRLPNGPISDGNYKISGTSNNYIRVKGGTITSALGISNILLVILAVILFLVVVKLLFVDL